MPERTAQITQRAAQILPGEHAPASGEIAVQFHTDAGAFARLAPLWNRLHGQAAAASIFNSWIWQYQWWQVYGRERPLRLLVALEGGEAVGIVALYIQTVKVLGAKVRQLRFVGTGGDTGPDDLGPVLARGRENAAAVALARAALHVSGSDALIATDLGSSSPFVHALEQAAQAARFAVHEGLSQRISFIRLPETWEAFLKGLPSKRRSGIRCARAKLLAARPDTRFFVWDDPEHLDEAVDRLGALHRKRFQHHGTSCSFSSPEYIEFHRGVMRALMARNALRLYCLSIGGEIFAMNYCYRFRNGVYSMQAGFDPDLAAFAPGNVLLGYAIEDAIAEGHELFDFLRGEYMYKNQLANGRRETQCVAVFRPTAAGWINRLRRVRLPAWKARLLRRPVRRIDW